MKEYPQKGLEGPMESQGGSTFECVRYEERRSRVKRVDSTFSVKTVMTNYKKDHSVLWVLPSLTQTEQVTTEES